MLIRAETDGDHATIAEINRAAFASDEEPRLVELIRRDGLIIASLVAVDGSELVGHILFSPATIVTGNNEMKVASLAPMAVMPSRQRAGIGSMLVRRGLDACKDAGYRAVIVVGHPNYYPRFGFSHPIVEGLTNPFATGDAFMGLELARGCLANLVGRIEYPDVFNRLS